MANYDKYEAKADSLLTKLVASPYTAWIVAALALIGCGVLLWARYS